MGFKTIKLPLAAFYSMMQNVLVLAQDVSCHILAQQQKITFDASDTYLSHLT